MKSKNFLIALLAVIVCISGFAQAAEQPTPRLTLISNVNIFDGKTETLQKDMHVLVEGNLIKQISKEPLMVIQTDNVTIINGEGRTLMPGLTDCHWHSMAAYMVGDVFAAGAGKLNLVAAHGAEKTLMRGFTTVRDMGGPVFDLKAAIDEGLFVGPRIYAAGSMISQTSGHGDFRSTIDIPQKLFTGSYPARKDGYGRDRRRQGASHAARAREPDAWGGLY